MPTSIPVQPTITAAGLAAIFNAQSTGVEFALSHIAFGTAQYNPDGTETALQAEKVRVPIAGGGRISPTQIQIYAVAMAAAGDPFFVGEVGFFGDDGETLLALYSSTATPNLFLSDTVATSVSYALGLAALPANSVTVTIDPSASAALLLIGQHVASADPHPQYVEKVNGVAFYDPNITFAQGAEIIGDDLLVYQSLQANNIGHPPSSSPTWWVPLYNYGDTPVAGLANSNVTLTSTQAARAHITLSGALTANVNVIFPNWVKDWTVVNNTTGAFTVTCKTAVGTGVAIPQNGSPTAIHGDGSNITQAPENVAAATQPQHAVQLGQVSGVVGQVRNLKMSVAAANATATLTADEIIVETALGGLRYCLSNVNLNINLGTVGAGGMNAGTAPVNGYVGIYAIFNPTAATAALIAVNTGPSILPNIFASGSLPAGFAASALVAFGQTNASGQFKPMLVRDRTVSIPITSVLNTSAVTAVPLSIATAVPPNAIEVGGEIVALSNTSSVLSVTIIADSNQIGQQIVSGQTPSIAGNWAVQLATQQQINYVTNSNAGTPSFSIFISYYRF